MSLMVQALWLCGLAGFLAWVLHAIHLARRQPRAIAARSAVAAAALLTAGLAASGAWAWGIDVARQGLERIVASGEPGPYHAPARARLFLRHAQLLVPPGGTARIGYSPEAALRLPRGYGFDEAQRGWDLLEVGAGGPQGLEVVSAAPASTSTRILLHAAPRAGEVPPSPDALLQAATRLAGRGEGRCRGGAGERARLDGPGTVYAILCIDDRPRAALVFERDLLPRDGVPDVPVRVVPMVWGGRGFRPHHIQIASGELVQIGAMADALPGVTVWEVPAPTGRAELFFPPASLLAPCDAWLQDGRAAAPAAAGRPAGAERGFFSHPVVRGGEAQVGDEPVCVLPFTPPFGLEVRRLLPDVAGVGARSMWAAGLLVTPCLLLLMVLVTRPRGELEGGRFARALTLAALSVVLAALAVWRLLWAHRIDMLRDYESVGTRVIENLSMVAISGAALAALAVLAWPRRPGRPHALAAVGAWAAVLGLGAFVLRADLAAHGVDRRLLAQIALALLIGTGRAWLPAARAPATCAIARLLAPLRVREDARGYATALAGLALLAVGAVAVEAAAPRAVALKLTGAWLYVLLVYTALVRCLGAGGLLLERAAGAFVFTALAGAAMARFDPGVTFAIAGPGILAALVIVAHDARWNDDALRRMDGFRRHHAPLLIAHTAAVGVLALGLGAWAGAGLAGAGAEPDALLSRSLTLGAVHLLLFAVVLFAATAALAHRRDGLRAALPWLVAAAGFLALWLARGALVDRVLGSSTQAANRIALVLDPGYALLRSDTKFLSGITAWRETIVPEAGGAALVHGQGYFGAQVIDPGVLLSIENDYLPVLVLRECGVGGIITFSALLLLLVVWLWLAGAQRFRHGAAARRTRALGASVLGFLCLYQPLASLGALPLTGIAWPGSGIDSPSDYWLLFALLAWILVWEPRTDDEELEELDAELRRSRLFRRTRAAVAVAAALAAVASMLLIGRAAAFAARRPSPVDVAGRAVPPFDQLHEAVDYAHHLQCPTSSAEGDDPERLVPDDILGAPASRGARRFHGELRQRWREQRGRAVAALAGFLAGAPAPCRGTDGLWRFEHDPERPDECRLSFEVGWPAIQLEARRTPSGARVRCRPEASAAVLRQLRFPARRPYENARVRLVSRAMGAAAADRGELVSGHLVVRLRPGAGGPLDVTGVRAGLHAAEEIRISPALSIRAGGADEPPALLRRTAPAEDDDETFLLVREPPASPVQVLEADAGRWRLLPTDVEEVPLERVAVIVVTGPRARSLWLFRPPSRWHEADGDASAAVDPLLADDVATVQGERRRHYLYGGLLPELGWVNPYHARMSLGLDGWVRVALAEYEDRPERAGQPPRPPTWQDHDAARPYCGHLDAPTEPAAERLGRVCRASALDGVLECRVGLQPELGIRLQHLLELISQEPARFTDPKAPLPLRANLVLLRGDTGEILAQGEHVPGRASSAYAPATPELEQHLIRLREDRDPVTGYKLPAAERGEASAEKVDWNHPIALGSTLKPLLARAVELADPDFLARLSLRGSRFAGARCRSGTHAILGHCPPTDSVWNQSGGPIGARAFLSHSLNWYQAALGILGTAAGGGTLGSGELPSPVDDIAARDLGDWPTERAVWTRQGDQVVVGADQRVDLEALRRTPMWRELERLLGRTLCTAGSKRLCQRAAARKDLCAARSLPIDEPSADLRHLVALGPSQFDVYPRLADPSRRVGPRVSTREYLQFLRGSGLHPVGSLAQLADAFNRLIFDDASATLAASWFPAPATAPRRRPCGGTTGSAVHDGLCAALESGTAAVLAGHGRDRGIVYYGAKTGTIDSLADIAENRAACERFNQANTIPGRPAEARHQPYWLTCGKVGPEINDSLLVVSFAVPSHEGMVPLTLALRFQRGGVGMATLAARHAIDVVAAYFAPPETPAIRETP